MSDRGLWLYCCAALLCTSACKVFESTCDEADRSCLGGGLGRSGEACVRSGDCATGMECREQLCVYAATTKRGSKCVASAECEAGTYCSSKLRCTPVSERPRAAGLACSSSADCARGLTCDLDLAQAMAAGPYAQLDESCRTNVADLETDELCLLPRVCTERGSKDFSSKCSSNAECLPGLYCVDSPISAGDQTMCLGGVELPAEPITLPRWQGPECPKDVLTPTAYFEVPGARESDGDFYRLPYPNDVRRSNRQIDLGDHAGPPPTVEPAVASRFLSDAATRDGFSTNPVVFFRFSSAYATGNLSLSTVRIVDITLRSPEYNAPASIAWGPPERESHYICDHWLSLYRPIGSPLRPNTTYAAIVTRGLLSKQGAPYERGADFDALLSKTKPAAAALAAAWESYAPLRAWLADPKSGVAADDLLSAAVFTTGDPTGVALKLKAAVQADGVPQLKSLNECSAGASSPCAAADGRGACHAKQAGVRELHGKLSLPIFQVGTPPYLEPPDGGELALDSAGQPRVVRHEDVCFALSLP
ncbi:MAG TPA: hypothetical protein VJR89_39300, partial [Polyangiales bacterium]|nr:hypothetical protein [Polyangiales bacterium]